VSATDKKDLLDLAPMERNHLRYLLMTDPEIQDIKRNSNGVEVHMNLLLYGFGLFNHNTD
jgi:hypothetical protein